MISWRRINWIVALMKMWPIYNCTVVGAPIIHTLIHIMMMLAALSKFNLWMRWIFVTDRRPNGKLAGMGKPAAPIQRGKRDKTTFRLGSAGF